jgi:AraC family transcriptional regulator
LRIIDGTKKGASSLVFRNSFILSSSQNGWSGIDFEYHHQQPGSMPEHQNTELIISAIHSNPMSIQRRLASELREESGRVGEVQVNPAYSPHAASWDNPVSFSILLLKSSEIASATFDYADPGSIEILPHFSRADPLLYGLMQSIKVQMELKYTVSKIYLESIRSAAIFHLLQNYSNRKISTVSAADGLSKQSLKKAIDYVHNNFQKDLGLFELADLVGLSSRYFSELFKASTGDSPCDYLLKFRLTEAAKLLLTTELPVSDIANFTGFSSASNFCRAFRKHYSISPSRYRGKNT